MDINKQKARLIKRFNTIQVNLNKELVKSSKKEKIFNEDKAKASVHIQTLHKFIKDNNLSKHIYPIRLKNVRYKGAKLTDKTIDLNNKLTKINNIIIHINNTDNQNDLTILNHLIDDKCIFDGDYKIFSKSKAFNDKLDIDYIFDDVYCRFVIKIGDINFIIANIYMPLN